MPTITQIAGRRPKTVLITGANRGLGLELVKQVLVKFKPAILVATYRDVSKSKELQKLASNNPNLHLIEIDVRDVERFPQFVSQVDELTNGSGLNLLVNNAGVFIGRRDGTIRDTCFQELLDTFLVNTFAPVLLTKAFLPLLEKSSSSSSNQTAVVNMTSTLGSINLIGKIEGSDGEDTLGSCGSGGFFAYRLSKTALNSATRAMAFDLKAKGILSVAIHPGWSQTEMGTMAAPLKPVDGIAGVISVLEKIDETYSGRYFSYTGEEIPW